MIDLVKNKQLYEITQNTIIFTCSLFVFMSGILQFIEYGNITNNKNSAYTNIGHIFI